MTWITAFKNFTADTVRQNQFFMVCRHSGIILSSVVVAHFLPLEGVGIFEMLVFCGYLMTFFWADAILRGYLATPVLQDDKTRASSFLCLYFLFGVAAMIILFCAQKLLVPLFTSQADLPGLELFIVYQILIIPLWAVPFIGILKGQNTMLLSFYVLIGPSFACLTGFTSIEGMTGGLIGLFSYALVGFIWILIQSQLVLKLHLRSLLIQLWPATWPLVMVSISTGLARSFDAWLVAHLFDESSFAIFRYGAREFPLVVALSVGLSTTMIPRLRQSSSLPELKSRSIRLMHTCYPIVALLILFSPPLFTYVFGNEYKFSALIFNVYLLLGLTQFVFPQSILMARGDTRILWHVSLLELVVNIVASVVLMHFFGLIGIAWGTLIAFVFEKIVLLMIIRKRYNILVSETIDIKTLLFYALVMFIFFILSTWLFGV